LFGGGIAYTQDTEVAVDVTDATEAGHNLLADVATFGGTDGVGFKPGFGREGVGSDIHSPKRKATTDAEGFPICEWRGVGAPIGWCGNPKIESWLPKARA
jgi:hypothetical protein